MFCLLCWCSSTQRGWGLFRSEIMAADIWVTMKKRREKFKRAEKFGGFVRGGCFADSGLGFDAVEPPMPNWSAEGNHDATKPEKVDESVSSKVLGDNNYTNIVLLLQCLIEGRQIQDQFGFLSQNTC